MYIRKLRHESITFHDDAGALLLSLETLKAKDGFNDF